MSALKYIERLKTMDYYIRHRITGTPAEFASKLGMSVRSLYDYLDIMKELGAPLAFSFQENSYIYCENGKLKISFLLNDEGEIHQNNGKGTHFHPLINSLFILKDLTQLQSYCSMIKYF